MRSKKVTLSIPWPLWEAYEKHAPEVGYQNASQMLVWSSLYSLTVGKPHHATAPIASAPPAVQDLIIKEVVGAYLRGEVVHGSYFERMISNVVARFKLPVDPAVLTSLVREAITTPSPSTPTDPQS